ncbi:hypothetical protein NADFUDRAFT_82505 [Nadsonia fulvescens var. elongata DSM 6958]|uniref:Uncharacterized protein n=1 Tax=Nadsonia fulvescens var. elongata DSM 6958 TaxID=857566 RepID=A0A1E3PMY0_9ASCO|nr:hypothetical protein NADFUDRAFT_82505 [Nadsonia fulvescens var. elongata DSM 6958]
MTYVHSSASSIRSVESYPASARHPTGSQTYLANGVSNLSTSYSNPNIPSFVSNGIASQLFPPLSNTSARSVNSGNTNLGASSIAATDGSDSEYQRELIDSGADIDIGPSNEFQDDFSVFNQNAFLTHRLQDHSISTNNYNTKNNTMNTNKNNNASDTSSDGASKDSEDHLLDPVSVWAREPADLDNNVPSRPLSRASTLSGVSITANLDGIEGKRINKHRVEYPMSYSVWNNCQELQVLDQDKQSALKKLLNYSRNHIRSTKSNAGINDSNNNSNKTTNRLESEGGMNPNSSEAGPNTNSDLNLNENLHGSVISDAQLDFTSQEPVSLNEKIRLLGDVQPFDRSGNGSLFSLRTRDSLSSSSSQN